MIHSEGNETTLEMLSVCQSLLRRAESEKIGNTSDDDTLLRRSPPGIAGESVLPTPAVMRTDGTRWARRRRNLWLGLDQGKDLNVLPAPVDHPGAAKRSTCHIHPPHRSNNDGFSLHRGRWRARDDGRDFPDEHDCLWLLGLDTAPAEDS